MTVSVQTADSAAAKPTPAELTEETKAALKTRLKSWINTTLQKDQIWCLVDSRWLRQLQVFLGLTEPTQGQTPMGHPGPLDNSGLMAPDGLELKVHCITIIVPITAKVREEAYTVLLWRLCHFLVT